MEHRWGYRHEINKIVHLQMRNGARASGRIRNVSISGAWIVSRLRPQLMSYVEVGFSAMHQGRRIAARLEGVIIRIAAQGFGIEWCEFGHPGVVALLLAARRAGEAPLAARGASA